MMSFLENTNRANDTLSLVVLNEYIYSILHLIIIYTADLRRGTRIKRMTLNQEFLKDKQLKVQTMARGFAWLDTGTHDSLSEASTFIEVLEESLCIDWRIPTEHANLSEKDMKHVMLKDFESPFEY